MAVDDKHDVPFPRLPRLEPLRVKGKTNSMLVLMQRNSRGRSARTERCRARERVDGTSERDRLPKETRVDAIRLLEIATCVVMEATFS